MSPVGDLDQGFPEYLFGEIGADYVGAGNNQGIEPLLLYFLEALVVLIDMLARGRSSRQGVQRKWVHVKLGDGIAFADEAQNCRSVASSAASGIMFSRPICSSRISCLCAAVGLNTR